MTMYSWGEAPRAVIAAALPEKYEMVLTPCDQALVVALMEQGIDSHLEAITLVGMPEPVEHGKLRLVFDRPGMLCLIRRLWEHGEAEAASHERASAGLALDDTELPAAYDLRNAILSTLEIEEV